MSGLYLTTKLHLYLQKGNAHFIIIVYFHLLPIVLFFYQHRNTTSWTRKRTYFDSIIASVFLEHERQEAAERRKHTISKL